MKRVAKIAAAAALLTAAGTGTAMAASGTYTQFVGSIVYFYGRSSGSGQSYDFKNASSATLCLDAPGASARTMVVGELKENRRFASDPTLKQISAYYSDSERRSSLASLSTSGYYYSYAAWNYTSAEGYNANGYSRRC